MKPVIRFANDHPFMTRSDCGGAPGTNMIPGEGKKLNGNCVDKNTGKFKIEIENVKSGFFQQAQIPRYK